MYLATRKSTILPIIILAIKLSVLAVAASEINKKNSIVFDATNIIDSIMLLMRKRSISSIVVSGLTINF